jgi:fatty acid desaturase
MSYARMMPRSARRRNLHCTVPRSCKSQLVVTLVMTVLYIALSLSAGLTGVLIASAVWMAWLFALLVIGARKKRDTKRTGTI